MGKIACTILDAAVVIQSEDKCHGLDYAGQAPKRFLWTSGVRSEQVYPQLQVPECTSPRNERLMPRKGRQFRIREVRHNFNDDNKLYAKCILRLHKLFARSVNYMHLRTCMVELAKAPFS